MRPCNKDNTVMYDIHHVMQHETLLMYCMEFYKF
jgi:hypothetical protein